MISYDDIVKVFAHDLQGKGCIEIEFTVEGDSHYRSCWMGKTPDRTDSKKELFWCGLAYDGSESYAFDHFEAFITADVFDGKSLQDIWPQIRILTIDSCDPEWRLGYYLD